VFVFWNEKWFLSTIARFRVDRTVLKFTQCGYVVKLKDHILLDTLRVWSSFPRISHWDFLARIVDYFIVIIVFSRMTLGVALRHWYMVVE
jgi:hypothetical protein